ncbi:MAG TPA: hypothetical protein VMO26_16265 [Vicinamibacterales bacterium]|nr:hypothetical protein [Vicinamibacterales bacterium]
MCDLFAGADPQHLLARDHLAGACLMKGDLDRHIAESLMHARAAGCPMELLDDLRRSYETPRYFVPTGWSWWDLHYRLGLVRE